MKESVRGQGEQTIPQQTQQMRLWPRFHGLGVPRWSHPAGAAPWFCDMLLSLTGFAVLGPDLTKPPLIFGFNQLVC